MPREVKNSVDEEYLCGWGPFHPRWLQRFHNATCLAISLMLTKIVHGILLAGFVSGSVSQLIKKFHFTGSEIAAIQSCFEIATIVGLIILSYYGAIGHKGKYLGGGVIVYSIGALLYCIPQWFSPPYRFAGAEDSSSSTVAESEGQMPSRINYCDLTANTSLLCSNPLEEKSGTGDSNKLWFFVFCFASTLRGLGSCPFLVLGMTYLDENVSQKRSPMLLGFVMLGAGIGPVSGAILASICLKIYGDIGKDIDLDKILEQINPDDPRWYGAWWLGFLLVGIIGFFFSIPILGFARKLPNADEERKNDVTQEFKFTARHSKAAKRLKDLPAALFNLCKNYVFLIACLAHIMFSMHMSGVMLFGPKLLEDIFALSASDSVLIKALSGILPASFGMGFGGWLIGKLGLRCKNIMRLSAFYLAIGAPLSLLFLLHCEPTPLAGVIGVGYNSEPLKSGEEKLLTSECNSQCSCTDTGFQPVCNEASGISFYSPCHAGCTQPLPAKPRTPALKKWANCSCLNIAVRPKDTAESDSRDKVSAVHSGFCKGNCGKMTLAIAMLTVRGLILGLTIPTFQQGQLRLVGEEQRTMALSVTWITTRILGIIPGQQIMGAVIDSACEFGEKDEKKNSQTVCPSKNLPANKRPGPPGPKCIRYDINKLAAIVSYYGVILDLLAAIFYFAAAYFYKPAVKVEDSDSFSKTTKIDRIRPSSPVLTTSESAL